MLCAVDASQCTAQTNSIRMAMACSDCPPHFCISAGAQLRRVQLPARFSHDAIRVGAHVFVCSTGDGSILQLTYPGMQFMRSMQLFTPEDHPNTLAAAPAAPGGGRPSHDHLWVVLHKLGAVRAALQDLNPAAYCECTARGVLEPYQHHTMLVMLAQHTQLSVAALRNAYVTA
jgi:hypothetical protein